MKNLLISVLALLALACGEPPSSPDQIAIRLAFEEFQSAMTQDRFDIAFGCIDEESKAWFDEMLETARSKRPGVINQYSLGEKYNILELRRQWTEEELSTMNAEVLFRGNFELLQTTNLKFHYLGKIIVDGEMAWSTAHPASDVPFLYFSRRPGQEWKISVQRMAASITGVLEKAKGDSAYLEHGFLIEVLENRHLQIVDPRILNGPVKVRMARGDMDGWELDYPTLWQQITEEEPQEDVVPLPQPILGETIALMARILEKKPGSEPRLMTEELIVKTVSNDGIFFIGELLRPSVHHKDLILGAQVVFVPENVLRVVPPNESAAG